MRLHRGGLLLEEDRRPQSSVSRLVLTRCVTSYTVELVRDEVSLTLPVQSPSGLLPNDLVVADDDGDHDEDPVAVLLLVTGRDGLKRLLRTAKLELVV